MQDYKVIKDSLNRKQIQKTESDFQFSNNNDFKYVDELRQTIDRQKAEIENLTKVAEHQQSLTMDRGFEIKRLKAEIERLKTYNSKLETKIYVEQQSKSKAGTAQEPQRFNNNRLFVDMDGTLAQFHAEDNYLERMWEPGFFENLQPYKNALYGLKDFMSEYPDTEVFILSSAIEGEPPSCVAQKNAWLDKWLPEIDMQHRIFPPVGENKAEYIPNGINTSDTLLDDYNLNLEQWRSSGGNSVKFVNHINDRGLVGKKWDGQRLSYLQEPEEISAQLLSAVQVSGIKHESEQNERLQKELKTESDFQFSEKNQSDQTVKTNIGEISIQEYREIQAYQHGFDSYEDMYNQGFRLGNGYDIEPNAFKMEIPEIKENGITQELTEIRKTIAEAKEIKSGKELLDVMTEQARNWQPTMQEYREMLDFRGKFYRYSMHNISLIYMQNPNASYVGSFKHFKDLGYGINKGEHGMLILAPRKLAMAEVKPGDWRSMKELTDEQRAAVKTGALKIKDKNYFVTGYVFDISQTDCPQEDLPKLIRGMSAKVDSQEYYSALKCVAKEYGISFNEENMQSVTLKGYYVPKEERIAINQRLTVTDKATTLTHELSHALLHANGKELSDSQIEFEAESAAYITLKQSGFDMSDYSFRYIQGYLKNLSPEELQKALTRIDNCSSLLSAKLGEQLGISQAQYIEPLREAENPFKSIERS